MRADLVDFELGKTISRYADFTFFSMSKIGHFSNFFSLINLQKCGRTYYVVTKNLSSY